MTAARPRAAVIPIASRRPPSPRAAARPVLKIAFAFAVGVLGLVGSFADGALARSGLSMLGGGDGIETAGDGGLIAALSATLVANLAAWAGVVVILCWCLARPSADIVELRSWRARKR